MDGNTVAMTLMEPEEIPGKVRRYLEEAPGTMCREGGSIYCLAGEKILRCEDNEAGNAMISAVLDGRNGPNGAADAKGDIYRQILTAGSPERAAALAKQHGLPGGKRRCVILFRANPAPENGLLPLLRDMAPMEEDDHTVQISRDTVAVIKTLAPEGWDEITEYAAAVIDTFVSEGYAELQAGIGNEADGPAELQRSCTEARDALQMGSRYHPDKAVFRYSDQKLDRMIDQIPREARQKIVSDFFAECDASTLNGEMMETIRVFFRNDLNITSASRQLFIHRNTLNYRLDKIRRDTGLDLRTFQDAVIFRLISGMADEVHQNEENKERLK